MTRALDDREQRSGPAIRILHIEDDPLDGELVGSHLKAADPSVELIRVDTVEEIHSRLESGGLDLILSDYSLPGVDTVEVLTWARRALPDVPFIFLSGTMGEERAIESLHRGATDYVLKQRIERLVPAVRRALQEAEEQRLRRAAEAARRQAEEALRESENRFRQIADSVPQIIWGARPEGSRDYYNRRWVEFTGIEDGEAGEASWGVTVHPDDAAETRRRWEHSVATGEPYEVEHRCRRRDGAWVWMLTRAFPTRDALGEIRHWWGSSTDVDRAKRLEEALRDADRRKDEFLAMLSHELRNPLAPMRNALEILDRAEPDNDTGTRARAIIERQLSHLTRIVQDLLDVSRITRGKIDLRRERLDLRDAVGETVEDHHALFAAAGVALQLEPAEEPLWVQGDLTRLTQAVGNLLVNAAKFTPRGGRAVAGLRREGSTAVFSVRDTGIGLDAEIRSHLFEPFAQADRSLDRRSGGLGLGLALTKGLVELHGGEVRARSDGPDRGSEFEIRLPLESRPAAATPVPQKKSEVSGPLRVLIVEDNLDTAETLKAVLEVDEREVEVAFTGPEGLEKARRFHPDVVLCDIGLPGMDGYEVARALRADEELHDVGLVALTGYASTADQEKAAAAGFDRHLAKPAEIAAIDRVLAELAGAN